MQYGDTGISVDALFQYMGAASVNHSYVSMNFKSSSQNVNQRDAELFHLKSKVFFLFHVINFNFSLTVHLIFMLHIQLSDIEENNSNIF